MFSSKSFIIFGFTFRSVIHFELIYVMHIRSVSRLTFFCMWIQFFQRCLMKTYLFSIVLPLLLCQRLVSYICVGLFLGSLSYSTDDLSLLSPLSYCLDYYSFMVSLKVGQCQFSNIVLLQYCVGSSASFFQNISSLKKIFLFVYSFGSTRYQLQHAGSLVVTCGISFPDQGSNPGPLHWEHGVLDSGPPGKSLQYIY